MSEERPLFSLKVQNGCAHYDSVARGGVPGAQSGYPQQAATSPAIGPVNPEPGGDPAQERGEKAIMAKLVVEDETCYWDEEASAWIR